MGTLAQAVAAGCPQLVLPNHFDQFDNARRLQRLRLALSHRGPGWGQVLGRLLNETGLTKACRERRASVTGEAEVLSAAADLIQRLGTPAGG